MFLRVSSLRMMKGLPMDKALIVSLQCFTSSKSLVIYAIRVRNNATNMKTPIFEEFLQETCEGNQEGGLPASINFY